MNQTVIIVIAAVVVILALLLFLVTRRKQRVTFQDRAPAPRPAMPAATPAPSIGGDVVDASEAAVVASGVPLAAVEAARAFEPPVGEDAMPVGGDTLTLIKGLGPKAAARLAALGITRFDQIAGWSEAGVATIDAQMGVFKGRIARDRWVEQAQLLATGDTAGFETEFGKLGG